MFNIDEFYYLIDEMSRVRVRLGLSTKNVADACGVTTQTVRNFENLDCINPKLLIYYINISLKEDKELFEMLIKNCMED